MRFTVIILLEILFILLFGIIKSSSFYLSQLERGYPHGLNVFSSFLLFIVALDLLRRAAILLYARKKNQPHNVKDNFQFGINNIAKFILGVGVIITGFGLFGIDYRTLFTSLSIVAAAIAIISKEYLNDFLVGLYFSFSKDVEINDYIQLANIKGKVIEIQMLKIKILNDDDDLIIIPNSKVYSNEIINFTKRDIRLLSIDFQVDVNKIQNLELLEQELIEVLGNFSEFLEPNSFNLKIMEMKKDYIDLKFQYALKHLDRDLQKNIRKKTVRQVFNYISEKTVMKEDDLANGNITNITE